MSDGKVITIPKCDYGFSKVGHKGDVLLVYLKNGKFFICDLEFGVKHESGYYTFKRVFGKGLNNEKE